MEILSLASIRNLCKGKLGILFGSGPTVTEFNYEKDLYKDVPKFGINECVYLPIDLDYIVVGDHSGHRPASCVAAINEYSPAAKRLITGYMSEHARGPLSKIKNGLFCPVVRRKDHLTQNHIFMGQAAPGYNTRKFSVQEKINVQEGKIVLGPRKVSLKSIEITTKNIDNFASLHTENFSVTRYGSVSFDILQLMVWMGFEKIILIGHDSSYTKGTFRQSHLEKSKGFKAGPSVKLLDHWKGFHDYLGKYFPNVEIKSLRPVGLTPDLYPLFDAIDEENLKNLIKNSLI